MNPRQTRHYQSKPQQDQVKSPQQSSSRGGLLKSKKPQQSSEPEEGWAPPPQQDVSQEPQDLRDSSSSRQDNSIGFSAFKRIREGFSQGRAKPPDNDHNAADNTKKGTDQYIEALYNQIDRLEAEKKNYSTQIDQLSVERDIANDNAKAFKDSADKLQFAVENKELFLGQQASDDTVSLSFQELLNRIKTWSLHFTSDNPMNLEQFPQSTKIEFEKVAPDCLANPGFLKGRKEKRLFIRGWAGRVISKFFFRSLSTTLHDEWDTEDKWTEFKLARSFLRVERSLYYTDQAVLSSRDFNDWRALTATLMSRPNSSDKKEREIEEKLKIFGDYIIDTVHDWTPIHYNKLYEELRPILLSAMELSQLLRCQRAWWTVGYVKSQDGKMMEFDKSVMNDKEGNDRDESQTIDDRVKKMVEIVVTPALFKCGDSNGERFEFESCVEPHEVKCKELPMRFDPPKALLGDHIAKIDDRVSK